MIVALVTTFNRPAVLLRSLRQIAQLGVPTLVVDDGSEIQKAIENNKICDQLGAAYMRLPQNRGLAAALNAGLSYWIADKSIDWISYFQDDVDVHRRIFRELDRARQECRMSLYTGHDSPYHKAIAHTNGFKLKESCAGVHMHASPGFWQSVMPIPTYQLGTPKRIEGSLRGIGSNVDWWIVRNSPHSVKKRRESVVCIPGMVRTFLYRREDSSWGNALPFGEEPPLAL